MVTWSSDTHKCFQPLASNSNHTKTLDTLIHWQECTRECCEDYKSMKRTFPCPQLSWTPCHQPSTLLQTSDLRLVIRTSSLPLFHWVTRLKSIPRSWTSFYALMQTLELSPSSHSLSFGSCSSTWHASMMLPCVYTRASSSRTDLRLIEQPTNGWPLSSSWPSFGSCCTLHLSSQRKWQSLSRPGSLIRSMTWLLPTRKVNQKSIQSSWKA